MITPTVGRVVWFRGMNGHVHAAVICHVHSDHEVNLTVYDADGTIFARHHVTLAQDRAAGPFECEWMPHEREAEEKAEVKAKAKSDAATARAALAAAKKGAQ